MTNTKPEQKLRIGRNSQEFCDWWDTNSDCTELHEVLGLTKEHWNIVNAIYYTYDTPTEALRNTKAKSKGISEFILGLLTGAQWKEQTYDEDEYITTNILNVNRLPNPKPNTFNVVKSIEALPQEIKDKMFKNIEKIFKPDPKEKKKKKNAPKKTQKSV